MGSSAITLPDMGRKKSDKQGASDAVKADPHKGVQVPFRVDDPRLIEAIEGYAESQRRSRNMAIILLLERALTDLGRWPPKG